MKLKRQDWIERSPNQGDLFYNLWIELLDTSHESGVDAMKSPPNSPRKGRWLHCFNALFREIERVARNSVIFFSFE